ncbi:MAG: hypothetical protein C4318_07365 [Acidimicrobiia bacterium]
MLYPQEFAGPSSLIRIQEGIWDEEDQGLTTRPSVAWHGDVCKDQVMRLLRLDFKDPSFPISLVEADNPPIPNSEWALCRVIRGGICGSDLGVLKGKTVSPLMANFVGFPMDMGHEIGAVVEDPGSDFPFKRGTRIAVDPVIGCAARGITPACPYCASGSPSCCENLSSRALTPGFALGYTNGLGGGWAEMVAVHSSMAYEVPQGVPDESTSLAEPLSVAVHGILGSPPPEDGQALVVGCGIIGLAAIAALRYMFPDNFVVALARHRHQAEAAEALGANLVVLGRDDAGSLRPQAELIEELAQLAESRLVRTGNDAMLAVGFPYVIEAAGTRDAIDTALRCTSPKGTLLFLGVAGKTEIDLTPVWLKEIRIQGSFCHGFHPSAWAGRSSETVENTTSSLELALEMLAAGRLPYKIVVSAEFPLSEYRAALATAKDHATSSSIKVVFDPQLG